MPTFCRHNRFIDRCPICSQTLPDHLGERQGRSRAGRAGPAGAKRRAGAGGASGRKHSGAGARGADDRLRVRHQSRALQDGFHSELVPGIRASSDAAGLAQELAFAAGRLERMTHDPPGLLGEIRARARAGELEAATWMCFVSVYLCPRQQDGGEDGGGDGDPFAAIERVLEQGESPSLEGVALGPRSSHEPARGNETLVAFRQWRERGGAPRSAQRAATYPGEAFVGERMWTPERRFERVFERLALPGLRRMGRYELLVTLGRLGLYELRADSLHLSTERAGAEEDLCTLAAKRIFAIGDPLHLERRARALADAVAVPIEALDLGLANWSAGGRATLGFAAEDHDEAVLERARDALGL